MRNLRAEYIKEREGVDTIDTDYGFLEYEIIKNGLLIRNLYVAPSHRNGAALMNLINMASDVAKENCCDVLIGTIQTNVNGASRVMAAALKIGFQIVNCEDQAIWIRKEITHG